jgi:hypothetical protein
MRFRFCGDLDCPDWVLAHMSHLSKLSSVKLKLMANEIVTDIVEGNLRYEKLVSLTSTAKFEDQDIRASSAALLFILSSSAKYSVESETLSHELQQLGLPKEHATTLCKVYADQVQRLRSSLKDQSLRLSSLESVEWKLKHEVTSEGFKLNISLALIEMDIKSCGKIKKQSLAVSPEKLSLLLLELKQISQMMDNP